MFCSSLDAEGAGTSNFLTYFCGSKQHPCSSDGDFDSRWELSIILIGHLYFCSCFFFFYKNISPLFKCNSSCRLPFAVDNCFFFYCSLQFCNRKVTSPCKLCSIFLSSLCEFTLHRNKFLYFIVISILFTGFVMFCGYCTCWLPLRMFTEMLHYILCSWNRYQDTEDDEDVDGEGDLDSIMEIIKVTLCPIKLSASVSW